MFQYRHISLLCPCESPLVEYYKGYACGKTDKEIALKHYKKAETLSSDYCFPNGIEEMLILENAIASLVNAPMANYYLGCLLYDKKQYERATECWEITAAQKGDFALCYRNLSIAYYNKYNDDEKALNCINKACELEPNNSRFLLEKDQLSEKIGINPQKRLSALEEHKELLEDRDTLCLSYITILNACGRFDEALTLLENHKFHVWEGGEGKAAEQYKISLFALAEKEMKNGNYKSAVTLCERTLSYPENLGEGKLFNVPDNNAYYLIGKCLKALGENEKAKEYFSLAAHGSTVPETVRYYNDQPSDYIYYIGLAFVELGEKAKAKQAFESLVEFGNDHIDDKIEYDFFAVSLPELTVYQDDLQKRNQSYCKMLIELGKKGLEIL